MVKDEIEEILTNGNGKIARELQSMKKHEDI